MKIELEQIETMVNKGESDILEFKSSTGSLSVAMQTVCAFLNSKKGGAVLFGVTDQGKILGQHVSDKTKTSIASEMSNIEPYEDIDIRYVPIDDSKQVIVFLVDPGEHPPYTYDGRHYMRNQSTTTRMPKDMYMNLYHKTNPKLWEGLTSNGCTIEDLDHVRIKSVVRKAVLEKRLGEDVADESISDILKGLKLIVKDKLTNAAVILFCKNPDKQFEQSLLKIARFKGTTKNDFLDIKSYKANAFDLYDEAEKFLVSVLPLAARIVQGQSERVETPAIPYSVLREALINALIHRDYSLLGGSMSVSVFDDRVEISNIGSLLADVEVSSLTKKHESIQRNPLIARIFWLCKKIERWGKGTLDMIRDSEAAGNPLPAFEETGGGFSVTLPLKESIRMMTYADLQKAGLSKLTDRQQKIIHMLQKHPLNRQQIMEKLGITITDRAMQLELAKLKNLGLIRPEGKGKALVWALIG